MSNEYVIVTGGAGYIGSQACKKLSQIGLVPVTIDNLSTGWSELVKFGPFERVDLLDRESVSDVFYKYKPKAVMHFAALSQVSESVLYPGKYWKNNVMGSINLIQAALEHKCKNLVFSSTCATYGDHDNVVLSETSSQHPTSPYGCSKRATEEIIKQFSLSHGLRYVIFRYFNVAGADPEAEIGEFHKPETHLIPLVLDVASGHRAAINIFGIDYKTPDGTCIRDYVHVCDLVDAHILGLKWLEEKGEDRIYNLGTGKGYSVREVIENAKDVTKKHISILESDRRLGDCTKLVSGSQLAQNELGWRPYRSTLNTMIADAWRWHQNSPQIIKATVKK